MYIGNRGYISQTSDTPVELHEHDPAKSLVVGAGLFEINKLTIWQSEIPVQVAIGGNVYSAPVPAVSLTEDTYVEVISGRDNITALRFTNSNVKSIGASFFSGMIYLQDIGEAFKGCTNLSSTISSGMFDAMPWYASPVVDVFENCSSLTTVEAEVFDHFAGNPWFGDLFKGCALTTQSVDNVLADMVTSGEFSLNDDNFIDLTGGSNQPPSAAGLTSKATLESRGWTVNVNV